MNRSAAPYITGNLIRVQRLIWHPAEGIGSGIINTDLPDRTTNRRHLNDVLFIPTLGHNLLAWDVIKLKSVTVAKAKDVHISNKNNLVTPIFVADIKDELPWIHARSPQIEARQC